MSVVTRFAPSPTGYLHVGSVRTALYCYLYAKRQAGDYVLRIEDTDRERSTQEAVDVILEGLDWLGLTAEKPPVFQTQRLDKYQEAIDYLLETDQAYRCDCSKERLEALRETQIANKEKPKYDGHCRNKTTPVSKETPHVIRFKNPLEGEVVFEDLVRGKITVANKELDDLILVRSDGTPTYNLTVVIDDWQMGITHVIRGDDHINNTPRQINVLKALKAPIPTYAHLPMILGPDGKRLSKRHGAVSVLAFRQAGILPQALLNYLVRLGWSHGDTEIFSQIEMESLFDLKHVQHAPASFSNEKLLWLNQHYLKTLPTEVILPEAQFQCAQLNLETADGPDLSDLLDVQKERINNLRDLIEQSRYFYEEFSEYDEKAVKKHIKAKSIDLLKALLAAFEKVEQTDWNKENLHGIIQQVAADHEVGLGKVGMPLRVAVTGGGQSPALDATLYLLGRQKVLSRLNKAIDTFETQV